MLTVSTLQPTWETLLSDAQRKRSLMDCPLDAGGRLIEVVTNPAEVPLKAWRPAIGLPKLTLIGPVYACVPATKLPPAVMMSWNAPAFTDGIEISTTPPSNVLSRLKLCLKVNFADADVIAMAGVSLRLSRLLRGSVEKMAFGAVSAGGAGVPALEVTHIGAPVTLVPCVATHPAGRAGATTPSKFSLNAVFRVPRVKV